MAFKSFSSALPLILVAGAAVASPATPFWPVGIAEMGVEIEAHGVVADGLVREAFSVSGLTLSAGVLPDWAVPLLPEKASIDFSVSNFDLAGSASILLDLLDLPAGTAPDPMLQETLLVAIQPDGALVWEIGATTPGSVKINGTEMMGGP